jgi:glycosyltransferase involved in cell wall biosynthesis
MGTCHVVLLSENLPFARDRRIKREALALREAGYKVSVVCPKDSERATSSETSVEGVSVYSYGQPCQGTGILNYFLEYSWAIFCSFWIVAWIWSADDVDILHAANPPDLFFLVAIPFILMRKKFIFDQHDLCPELFRAKFHSWEFSSKCLTWLERWSYRLSDLVIVTNESAREIAVTRGRVSPDKIRVVRNGPDLTTFHVGCVEPRLKKTYKYLALYIGAMGSQDGVDRIVQAVYHVVHERKRNDVLFVLLGDGDYLLKAKQLAKSLQVERYIDFRGWVGDVDLLQHLSTADVCLAPDPPTEINHKSTFIKVMEYMSCGKATVSFDLTETRRVAGCSAAYVPSDDASVFGDAILDLLDDPERRESMGRDGLERAQKSFHWGLSREILLQGYADVLAGNRSRCAERPPSF